MMCIFKISLVAGYLAIWFSISLVLEYHYAISTHVSAYLILLVFALLPTIITWSDKGVQFVLAIFLVAMTALSTLNVSPVKPFCEFYSNIENGMNAEEIQELLAASFP